MVLTSRLYLNFRRFITGPIQQSMVRANVQASPAPSGPAAVGLNGRAVGRVAAAVHHDRQERCFVAPLNSRKTTATFRILAAARSGDVLVSSKTTEGLLFRACRIIDPALGPGLSYAGKPWLKFWVLDVGRVLFCRWIQEAVWIGAVRNVSLQGNAIPTAGNDKSGNDEKHTESNVKPFQWIGNTISLQPHLLEYDLPYFSRHAPRVRHHRPAAHSAAGRGASSIDFTSSIDHYIYSIS
jgi:hypothetical protein